MRFDIISLFPKPFDAVLNLSLLGKARREGIVEIYFHDLNHFVEEGETRDDAPYGGGGGMVMRAEPVIRAARFIRDSRLQGEVVFLTPQGERFDQELAKQFSRLDQLVFVSGRYEGIDERAFQAVGDREVSLGDFVLSGGEIAAVAMIDCVARLIPGVIRGEKPTDSFSSRLLKYPQYTRPHMVEGHEVPAVLLSGDHGAISVWRKEQAHKRTQERRPDLKEKNSVSD